MPRTTSLPFPVEPHNTRRATRLALQAPIARQHELPTIHREPASSSTGRGALQLESTSVNLRMTDFAKEANPKYARKAKSRKRKAIELPDVPNCDDRIPGGSGLSNAAMDKPRILSTAARSKEVEKQQATTIEYLENLVMEHARVLAQLPSPKHFAEMSDCLSFLEEKVHYRDWDKGCLWNENVSIEEEMRELKDSNLKMKGELDEFRRYFGAIPPKYRRRDDLRGRPFKEWRRDPRTAVHRPAMIDTVTAERWCREKPNVILVSQDSRSVSIGWDSSDVTLTARDDNALGCTGLKRPREDDDELHAEFAEAYTLGRDPLLCEPLDLPAHLDKAWNGNGNGNKNKTEMCPPPRKRLHVGKTFLSVVLDTPNESDKKKGRNMSSLKGRHSTHRDLKGKERS